MLETIHIKNIDEELSEVLHSGAMAVTRNLPVGTDLHAYFSRSNRGIFTGSMHVLTKWGEAYAMVEDHNVYRMYNKLRDKVKKQVEKGRRKHYDHRFPKKNSKWAASQTFEDIYIEPIQKMVGSLKAAKVLIVDDDVDSMLWVDEIFRKFGCQTDFAIEAKDATKKISSCKADIIILDWMLNESTGREVIEKSLRTISKFEDLQEKFCLKKPKIVTYSGIKSRELNIPRSDYFEHIDHWSKPMKYDDIANRTSDLLLDLGI
ncbi:MAG: hypothetical protein CL677_01765 [Bdellovibrionaceae bacterium]|nr:hypothetical protein [Pseudobdellovibrionaceae bacterium]|tara:strand:+ start:3006 stop:3788 length:783 start_codon:yes stop_codon:yes gene_type:complete